MKHLRKITLLLAVFALLFSISCGDDDAGPDLSEVEIAFDSSNPPVSPSIITTMTSSSDPNAQEVGSNLATINAFTGWSAFFQQQQGATKTSTPIGTCGGDAVVYTYSTDSGNGTYTISYQICDEGDVYSFQMFYSENGSTPQLFIYAEQSKSGDQGYMNVYGSGLGFAETQPVIIYAWEKNADNSFTFTITDSEESYLYTINVNEDNSGDLSYVIDGTLYYEATWNATGTAGTYTNHNSGESGTWTS
ncbi:hypothetical protein [Ekhidna sp.]|uniref:hypothetical protein n=1 Tax=Ekhidna sp. TaxID=2608089 RepID=UPI003B58BDAD